MTDDGSARSVSEMFRTIACLLCCLCLQGCGTYVPNIQEFPGRSYRGQELVAAIVRTVKCSIHDAVFNVLTRDTNLVNANKGLRFANWLNYYGMQITLTLTIKESGSIAPSIVGMPPSPADAVFTIAGSGSLSSTATRTETLNYFYSLRKVIEAGPCGNRPKLETPPDSLLLNADLKIDEWLQYLTMLNAVGDIGFPDSPKNIFGQKIITHEVNFEVVSSGSLTPAFTLTRSSINSAGSFLTASRDRTHGMLITLGPIDPSQPDTLIRPAADQHFARQIGLAVNSQPRTFFAP